MKYRKVGMQRMLKNTIKGKCCTIRQFFNVRLGFTPRLKPVSYIYGGTQWDYNIFCVICAILCALRNNLGPLKFLRTLVRLKESSTLA